MEESNFRCEICDRTFVHGEALTSHNTSKHPESIRKGSSFNFKKMRNYGILILIVGLLIWGVSWTVGSVVKESDDCATKPVTDINIGGHNNLRSHAHADIKIMIDGVDQVIPSNIGTGYNLMRPLHTHTSDGEIHIEGPCIRDFTLGEFFDIWIKDFDSTKIFDKTTENGELKVYVDDVESQSFRNIVLRDKSNILIEYNSNN